MALKLDNKLVIGVSSRALFERQRMPFLKMTDWLPILSISWNTKTMFYSPELRSRLLRRCKNSMQMDAI